MQTPETSQILAEVARLVRERYVFPDIAEQIARSLTAKRDYPDQLPELAAAVTADLQAVNGDKHLRLVHHGEPLPERAAGAGGDDAAEYAMMTAWADRTSGGVARVERLDGEVGLLAIDPVLYPTPIAADRVSAAMTILADTDALIVDLRRCVGGEPTMVAFLAGYLFGHEPVQMSGLEERGSDGIKQLWTPSWVPGRRFGPDKPVFVLCGPATFSGGEALAYDLQQLGRARVVGEQTRGGANPREGFRVHPHLELTVSVARAVSPITGGNWEGVGVTPDIAVPAEQALDAGLAALRG
jgi:hypothetical protein